MMRHAAFFRGINVGGKHIVKMEELRRLFADCGFSGVKTYIQSENVVFETGRGQAELPGLIAERFLERFGFESPVTLRSADELDALLTALPFSDADIARAEAADPKTKHVYVFLSDQRIDAGAIRALQSGYRGDDRVVAAERELYLLCFQGILDSALAALLTKNGTAYTSRNLNTLRSIQALLRTAPEA